MSPEREKEKGGLVWAFSQDQNHINHGESKAGGPFVSLALQPAAVPDQLKCRAAAGFMINLDSAPDTRKKIDHVKTKSTWLVSNEQLTIRSTCFEKSRSRYCLNNVKLRYYHSLNN